MRMCVHAHARREWGGGEHVQFLSCRALDPIARTAAANIEANGESAGGADGEHAYGPTDGYTCEYPEYPTGQCM